MSRDIVKLYKDPTNNELAKEFAGMAERGGDRTVFADRKKAMELLRPETTALAVIDMQIGWCSYARDIKAMADRLARFVGAARDYGVKIVWLRNDEEFGSRSPLFDYYRVEPRQGETEIMEREAFGNRKLESFLRRSGTKTLLSTGVYTSACVASLAKEAPLHGVDSVIVSDLVADIDVPGATEGLYGAYLITYPMPSHNIIRAWARNLAVQQSAMGTGTRDPAYLYVLENVMLSK